MKYLLMTDNLNTRESKVARLIDEYGLDGLGDTLKDRWTANEDRSSLRELAEYFNRQLLQAAIEAEGTQVLDGEVENLYRLLTDDDVTSGVRQQAKSQLKNRGVNISALEENFVSYQSIRTYLKNERNASPPPSKSSPQDRIETKRSTVQQLTARLVTVTEQSLQELSNASILTLGDFDVIVNIRVYCQSCGTQQSVSDLFGSRGCACEE